MCSTLKEIKIVKTANTSIKTLKKPISPGVNNLVMIGNETELPFEDAQPDKRLHYVTGFDKANTKFMCIAEIEFCQVKNVFWDYLLGKYNNEK